MEGKEQATLRSERVPWSMKDLNSDLRKSDLTSVSRETVRRRPSQGWPEEATKVSRFASGELSPSVTGL